MVAAAGGAWEQTFVRQILDLHDKYMLYVNDCFANSSLFHKALKEAFETFCNKNVAGSSIAELMANFCDNLLRKASILLPGKDAMLWPFSFCHETALIWQQCHALTCTQLSC